MQRAEAGEKLCFLLTNAGGIPLMLPLSMFLSIFSTTLHSEQDIVTVRERQEEGISRKIRISLVKGGCYEIRIY